MATNYYVDFKNDTDKTWTMVVYQELPDSIELDSVAWKRGSAPKGGTVGVEWAVDYNVNLADYKQVGGIGVYKSSQTLDTSLGKAWQVVFQDNVQQLLEDPSKTVPADHILITNNSGDYANPGIGMSGAGSVYKRGVEAGTAAQFRVTPTYWIGLSRNVVLGEVISSNVITLPNQLKFTGGLNVAEVRAYLDGATLKLDIKYSQRSLLTAGELETFLSYQELHDLFLSSGLETPLLLGASVTRITPDEGKPNSQANIHGSGFGSNAGNVSVTFTKDKVSTGAKVDAVRDSRIDITVPQVPSGKYEVTAKVNGIEASGKVKYTVI